MNKAYLTYIFLHIDGFLHCSCKTYERYGYPCHHMLHVCDCKTIHDVQREWIDIRWTKDYLLNYLHKDTTAETNKIYADLKANFLPGIHYVVPLDQSYPKYKGFDNISIDTTMFNVPASQFTTQDTRILWIQQNDTNDPQLKQLLTQKDVQLINSQLHLSQEQTKTLQTINNNEFDCAGNNDEDEDEDEVNSICNDRNVIMKYTENYALFKRAYALANNDYNRHKKLYDMLSNFVIENEINHSDNKDAISNRDKGEKVLVSSNKILNTSKRSNKRKKACWE